jgi:hypothetical protein
VVNGNAIQDMDAWLVNSRPRRRASVAASPDAVENTQLTDASTQPSQSSLGQSVISDAASEALALALFKMIIRGQVKKTKKKTARSILILVYANEYVNILLFPIH